MGRLNDSLVVHAVSGDTNALGELLRTCGPIVRLKISGRIPPRWRSLISVDDVLQQTYADAFRGIQQFKSKTITAFVSWLTSLARCNILDAVKAFTAEKRGGRRGRVRSLRNGSSFGEPLAGLTSGSTPSRCVSKKEDQRALRRAIKRLPQAYRCVIELCDLDGQEVSHAAKVLGRSSGAVHMLRARAYVRLRELLSAGDFSAARA